MELFKKFKQTTLADLEADTNVDPLVRPLLDLINSHQDFVTIVSCSGHSSRRFSQAMVEFVVRSEGRWDLIKETDLQGPLEVRGVKWVRMNLTKVDPAGEEPRVSIAFFTEPGVKEEAGVAVLTQAFRVWLQQ